MGSTIDGILHGLHNRHKDRIRQLVKKGWTVTRTKSGHIKLVHPKGGIVISSSTSSDWRSDRAFERDIRRTEKENTDGPQNI
jgi:predicted RNA binding protein YcfA (HicA-like mRNA interferase family)